MYFDLCIDFSQKGYLEKLDIIDALVAKNLNQVKKSRIKICKILVLMARILVKYLKTPLLFVPIGKFKRVFQNGTIV